MEGVYNGGGLYLRGFKWRGFITEGALYLRGFITEGAKNGGGL